MGTVRSVAGLLRGSGRLLALSVALAVLQSALLIPVALLVRYSFDTLIPADRIGRLALVGALALVLFLASAGIGLWTRYLVLGVNKRAITDLRLQLFERLHQLPRSWFDTRDHATLHSSVVQDTERLDVMMNALLAQLVPAAIVGAALAATLLALQPLLFGLLVLVVPPLVVVNRVLGRAIRRWAGKWQRAFDVFSGRTLLTLRSMSHSRAHALEEALLASTGRELAELGEAGREMAWRTSAYTLVQGAIGAISAVAVLVGGGAAVAAGTTTVGELISFYAVAVLLRGQLATVLLTVPQVIAGAQSLERVRGILEDEEREPYRGAGRTHFRGGLALQGVDFGYPGHAVLRAADLVLEPGERVALLGPSGAGKSTILKLLVGLYRPSAGRVLADGVPLDDLDLRAIRRRLGVLLDEPVLFPGTIAENVAYGEPAIPPEAIERAAELATVTDFTADLPDGLHTQVGDGGLRLSAGQRQRVAMARALVRSPAALLLDEPTDHLDSATAERLIDNLRRLPGAPSVLLVTHDPEVARAADRAYRLVDGRTVAAEAGAGVPA